MLAEVTAKAAKHGPFQPTVSLFSYTDTDAMVEGITRTLKL